MRKVCCGVFFFLRFFLLFHSLLSHCELCAKRKFSFLRGFSLFGGKKEWKKKKISSADIIMVNCQIATFKKMKILEGKIILLFFSINLKILLLYVALNQPQTSSLFLYWNAINILITAQIERQEKVENLDPKRSHSFFRSQQQVKKLNFFLFYSHRRRSLFAQWITWPLWWNLSCFATLFLLTLISIILCPSSLPFLFTRPTVEYNLLSELNERKIKWKNKNGAREENANLISTKEWKRKRAFDVGFPLSTSLFVVCPPPSYYLIVFFLVSHFLCEPQVLSM